VASGKIEFLGIMWMTVFQTYINIQKCNPGRGGMSVKLMG